MAGCYLQHIHVAGLHIHFHFSHDAAISKGGECFSLSCFVVLNQILGLKPLKGSHLFAGPETGIADAGEGDLHIRIFLQIKLAV